MNANKREYICYKQKGAISTLKLVDQFVYLRSNIPSTESDINICQAKAWNIIDRLSILWKFDLSNKIKQDFFQAVAVSIQIYGCTIWTQTKCIEKKLNENNTRMLRAVLNNTQQNNSWTATCLSSHTLFK